MLKDNAKNVPLLRIMVLLQRCGSSQLHALGNWLYPWSEIMIAFFCVKSHWLNNTYFGRSAGYNIHLESHCALRLRYIDLVVSIEVAVEVCCCCVTFHCIQLLNSSWSAIPVKCLIAYISFYLLRFFQLRYMFFLLNTSFQKARDTLI